jgi:hypothetical protein
MGEPLGGLESLCLTLKASRLLTQFNRNENLKYYAYYYSFRRIRDGIQ